MFEGQTVDNSASSSPEPVQVAPEGATQAPTQEQQAPVFQPGDRSPELLQAILDGADPTTLFSAQPEAAAEPEPQQPIAQEPPVQPEPQIPDKFRNSDGTLNANALLKSYMDIERAYGEQGNRMGQMIREFQQLRETIQQGQQPQTQQAQPEHEPEPELTPEQELEKYYEDPVGFQRAREQKLLETVQKMVQEAIQPLNPVVEKMEYDRKVRDFAQQIAEFTADGRNADYYDLAPQMQQIINKYGDAITSLPNAVEVIYTMAKGTIPPPAPPEPPPTVEQMLTDPNIRQKIVSDPNIVAEITKGYVQEVKSGAPPVVLGTQQGGVPLAAPSEKPRSVREASSIFSRFLRQQ